MIANLWMILFFFFGDVCLLGDTNSPRLEIDFKLDLPIDRKESFLAYLHQKIEKNSRLKLAGKDLRLSYGEEIFTDAYFDDDRHTLLDQQAGLRYRKRNNLTDPKNRKHGRELVQLKLDTKDASLREEFKFKPEKPSLTGGIFQTLSSKDQKNLSQILSRIKVNPAKMEQVLTISQKRHRFMIHKDDSNQLMTITLDECEVLSKHNLKVAKFVELEIEINEKLYTDATKDQRSLYFEFATNLKKEILAENQFLKVDQTPKYNKAYKLLK